MPGHHEHVKGTNNQGLDSLRKEFRNEEQPAVVQTGENKCNDKTLDNDKFCDKKDVKQSNGVDIDLTKQGNDHHQKITRDHRRDEKQGGGIDIDLTGQQADQDDEQSTLEKGKQKASEGMQTTKDKTGEMADKTKEKASELGEKAKEGGETLKDKLAHGLQKTKELFTGIDGDQSRDPSGLPNLGSSGSEDHSSRE